MGTQKGFDQVGITENLKASLEVFVDCVDFKELKDFLIAIVLKYIIQHLSEGSTLEGEEVEVFEYLRELFDFLGELEEEFKGD